MTASFGSAMLWGIILIYIISLYGKKENDFEMPLLCGILMVGRICTNLIQNDLSKSKVFVQVCK